MKVRSRKPGTESAKSLRNNAGKGNSPSGKSGPLPAPIHLPTPIVSQKRLPAFPVTPYVYGKLKCPRGHGQLVLGQLWAKNGVCTYYWTCLQCQFKRPAKHQGGSRRHSKTNRRNPCPK